MQDDHLREIRSTLAAVWAPGSDAFASFEVEGARDDRERWVQFIDGQLNVRWPRDDDPATGLRELGVSLPSGFRVQFHHPGENCVILCGDADLDQVAGVVLQLLRKVEDLGHGTRLQGLIVPG